MNIPKHIDSEGRNWGRSCWSGDSPIPQGHIPASWVKFIKRDREYQDDEERPLPVDWKSARIVQGVFNNLKSPVLRHVMCSYWVRIYILNERRSDELTVRFLNALVDSGRIDVPPGFRFSLHQYRADICFIAKEMEAAFEICV